MREVRSLLWGSIDVESGDREVCVKTEDRSQACIANSSRNV